MGTPTARNVAPAGSEYAEIAVAIQPLHAFHSRRKHFRGMKHRKEEDKKWRCLARTASGKMRAIVSSPLPGKRHLQPEAIDSEFLTNERHRSDVMHSFVSLDVDAPAHCGSLRTYKFGREAAIA
ncbi:hypothetical protein TNCV_1738251 [Trichonephila clavipes]|nr:hypothetical protein TNCV_1738251 [Trichonephila clavipes]